MPIDDMPIIEIVVRQLVDVGVDHITLAVGHLAELLMAFLGDGERFGVRIDYVREETPLGTAGPLRRIGDLPEEFLVMNGDLLTTLDYQALIAQHRAEGNALTIASHHRQVNINFGIMKTDDKGRVLDYFEKPSMDYEVSMGAYFFTRVALDYIPTDSYFDFPDLIRAMMEERRVGTYRHDGLWLDIGRHDDYEEAQRIFAEQRDLFPQNGFAARKDLA